MTARASGISISGVDGVIVVLYSRLKRQVKSIKLESSLQGELSDLSWTLCPLILSPSSAASIFSCKLANIPVTSWVNYSYQCTRWVSISTWLHWFHQCDFFLSFFLILVIVYQAIWLHINYYPHPNLKICSNPKSKLKTNTFK